MWPVNESLRYLRRYLNVRKFSFILLFWRNVTTRQRLKTGVKHIQACGGAVLGEDPSLARKTFNEQLRCLLLETKLIMRLVATKHNGSVLKTVYESACNRKIGGCFC